MRTHWRGSGIEPQSPACAWAAARLGQSATDASARIHSSSYCRAMGERTQLMDMRARLLRGGFDAARTSAALRTDAQGTCRLTRD